MKALTISQPFASMIMRGEKFVENRTWETRYRGQLLIHAGKGTQYLTRDQLKFYDTGGIVAVATLAECFHHSEIETKCFDEPYLLAGSTPYTWGELADHEHTEGPWCWVLTNIQQVEFQDCRGSQGLWNHPGGVVAV